jgi:hypothetical protein
MLARQLPAPIASTVPAASPAPTELKASTVPVAFPVPTAYTASNVPMAFAVPTAPIASIVPKQLSLDNLKVLIQAYLAEKAM